jgi:hypothetical protein
MNTAFPREWHSKQTLIVIPGYLRIFQNAVPYVEEVIKSIPIINNNAHFFIASSPTVKKLI